MESLNRVSNLSPASFERPSDRLTSAQVHLLRLLVQSVKNNTPITSEIILDFYIKHIKQSETYQERAWGWTIDHSGNRRYGHYGEMETKYWRKKYLIKTEAKNWFKNNLGAVIMKGKILIVPVIED